MTLITAKQRSNLAWEDNGSGSGSRRQHGWLFLAVALSVLILALAGYLLWPRLQQLVPVLGGSGSPLAQASGYQAVFLTNNQVYFGKLSGLYSDSPVLREAYYLKVDTLADTAPAVKAPVVAKDKSGKEATPAAAPKSTPAAPRTVTNLIKLGDELYGPVDEMRLNPDQILYVEDLRDNSQIVASIKSYQESLLRKN